MAGGGKPSYHPAMISPGIIVMALAIVGALTIIASSKDQLKGLETFAPATCLRGNARDSLL